MEVSVFRKEHFNAAHRLHNPNWSDERNKQVFGLCNNPNYHGHNYEIIVKVSGPINPDTGFVIDMVELKKIIVEQVCNYFDHKNLNLDIPEFETLNPTAENIVIIAWQRIKNKLPENLKLKVRLYETPRNFVEYPA